MADVASDVTIGMLGPLEVRVGFGEPVEVVGPRLRTLVIGLALDPDRVVLASQLIDAVLDGTAGGGDQRAWPTDTWAKVGLDPDQVTQAIIGCWHDGEVTGLQIDDLGLEEARSLTRPAMTYVRGRLRGRLTAGLARAHRRWLHPTSDRQPGDRFL
jgi:hypothetical protein